MNTVAVLDYGMGNLRSVCKAIEHVAPKATVQIVTEADAVRRADRVVFPGQGAIGGCVAALGVRGLREALLDAMRSKPFLGICLGLQALYERSEEGGGTACLGILPGRVKLFPRERMKDAATGQALKVPHMGWNQVHQERAHPLWKGIPQDSRFYFVHSYYAEADRPEEVAGTTEYALRFTSAAAHENIFAVQFHPEKSQAAGLKLLENFVAWDGGA
ncbi:MAG: imidazole glycerol phosphate synthase, glutamine amidotransferase subunit [Candidatus Muproteobacteria bacterium RBG_16_65_34]|uniref:Imidazole glycerol phosphate synthase subunit HisH n=1 Tax=Candidatus Muproteobacteria bacterium RBG_16_65_34 TaxID=1817760 RepID=A0A1F6TV11_9PROT|nr:MAG: imidazole glycerol phosphate synthase, glutamine amidotransferase subunit [Candidatus Muproteobacteria bacterium RBG_16_65_34]